MKHQKIITTLILLGLFAVAIPTLAVSGAEDRLLTTGQSAGFTQDTPLPVVVGGVIKALLSLLGVIFMGYILYAGWMRMSARGDEEKIKKSNATIRGGIIGLVITFAAYAITVFVIDRFTSATGYYDDAPTDSVPEE